MSDTPETPDPFGDLPPELRELLDQLGGAEALERLPAMLGRQSGTGPVNWELAGRAARQLAAEDDRAPTAGERSRHREALELAEHWLDASPLPAPPDAGRMQAASRQEWVGAALQALRPLVEPVAAASTRALTELTREELDGAGLDGLDLGPLQSMLEGMDLSQLLQPVGATMSGLHAGQVIGQLSRQLLGQYELGIPTAPPATAYALAVNIEEAFDGWDLDETEVAITLALHEAAHRRLFHGVPWLQAHLHGLVARFADGTRIDPSELRDMSRELMTGVDPEDPESLRDAMRRAAQFRLEPTPGQRRVLERIQGVICLVGAWARHEIDRCAGDRLPNLERTAEVLRRRRATKGDGEELLEQLLGLDLQPDDESVGEDFVAAVEEARGAAGLRRAMAHPENLPDAAELAEPDRWLQRMAGGTETPEDPSALFGDLGEAPEEPSAAERLAGDGTGPAHGGGDSGGHSPDDPGDLADGPEGPAEDDADDARGGDGGDQDGGPVR